MVTHDHELAARAQRNVHVMDGQVTEFDEQPSARGAARNQHHALSSEGIAMFAYYLQLGLRSLKRNPVLTALMVFGIALGIAATMTSLTVFHLMGSDPIPWKSAKLHYVQVDNWDPNQGYDDDGNPPDQLSHRDAVALMEAGKADRQAAMYKVSAPIQPENPEVKPYMALGRATYDDFFAMFEPPFQYGGAWEHAQDTHARASSCSARTRTRNCSVVRTASASA